MIRSFLFNVVFWPVFVIYIIVMFPVTCFLSPEWTLKTSYGPLTKLLLLCLKIFARIDYRVIGRENLPDGKQVIIGCNHQSAWETFIFSILVDNLAIVVKKQLMAKPIAGLYIKRLGCIPVDRESPVKAIKTLLKNGKYAYEHGKSILIFPNGTRASAQENHIEYKSGIFALYRSLNIPVVPVHVDSGKYWARNAFKKNPGTIKLEFKEHIQPGLNKDDFFAEFEKRMNDNV